MSVHLGFTDENCKESCPGAPGSKGAARSELTWGKGTKKPETSPKPLARVMTHRRSKREIQDIFKQELQVVLFEVVARTSHIEAQSTTYCGPRNDK